MSVLVFGMPASTPQPATPSMPALTYTWTGWDGSVWPLTPESGVWLDNGIRGLGRPDITAFKRQPMSVNGSVWYGYIVPERSVFWPLHMDFTEDLDRAFWRTMLPYKTGTWTVQTPSGQTRSLDLRCTDDGQWAPDWSPFAVGHAVYGVTLAAEQPLWRGVPAYQEWSAPTQFQFLGGGVAGDPQLGPPFYINQHSSFNNAQIINDGDVETWPVWVVNEGATSATLGIGSDMISVPFAVPSGQRLVIDTNPTKQTALMGDPDPGNPAGLVGTVTNQTRNLESVTWSMIPPGETVDLSITMTGAPSTVGVQFTPHYLRAW